MSFVEQVPFLYTSVYAPINDVQDTITYTRNYADEQRRKLEDAIANLESAVGQYSPSFGSANVNIPELNFPIFPDAPDSSADLNENWPQNNTQRPTMRDIAPDYSFVEPVPPDQVDPSFDYTPGVYSSCIWTDLCTKIKDELINGGNGLSDLVYSLILDRNAEARRAAEDRSRRQAYDSVGARGFNLAGGMAAEVVLQHEREVMAKDIDAINSTTIKDFEIADANARFIKDISLKMEGVQRNQYDNDEDRLFEIAKVSRELVIAIFEQNTKIYIAQWEGVKIRLESIKTQVDAVISLNEGDIKIFIGEIEAYKTEIEAIAVENKSKTDLKKTEADIYESQIRGIVAKFTAQVEEIKVKLEQYRIEVSEIIDKEKINLDAYASSSELAARISESIANIASQSVASALQALNTSMSISYSGNESLGYSSSISNSLSEGHSYEEV